MKKIIPILLAISLLIAIYVITIQKDEKDENLKSLIFLEESLENSNRNLQLKNKISLAWLKEQAENRPEELIPYYNRAVLVRNASDSFVKHLKNLKYNLVRKKPKSNEYKENDSLLLTKMNYNLTSSFIDEIKISRLVKKVDSIHLKLLDLLRSDSGVKLDPEDTAKISSKTYLNSVNYDWRLKKKSLSEVILFLSKLENDCRNMEADILDILKINTENCGPHFDPIYVRVLTNSHAVMVGSEYRAEVFLICPKLDIEYEAYVDGKVLPKEGHISIYTNRPQKEGIYSFSGVVKIKLKDGIKEYPFTNEYQAFMGNSSITNEAEDILYIGYENRLSILLAGYSPSDIVASISNGSLVRKDKGFWVAKVTKPGSVVVFTSVKLKDGTIRKLSEKKYIVKNFPIPNTLFGNLTNGKHSIKDILNQRFLNATLTNYSLENIKYNIIKYSFSYFPFEGTPVFIDTKKSEITREIKAILKNAKPHDRLVIDRIEALLFGKTINLNPLVLEIE